MSAYSHNVKNKFGGFFKSLFGRGSAVDIAEESSAEESHTPVTIASSKGPAVRVSTQSYSHVQNGNGHTNVDTDDFRFSHSLGNANSNGNGNGHAVENGQTVDISLQAIICAMPPELRSRVRGAVSDDIKIPVSLDKIVSQLSQGAVKIPFGDIRKAAAHVFAPPPDADQLLVPLPLSEILPYINPSMLNRRPAQKPAPISDEITSPFALGGQGLVIAPEKPRPTPPTQMTRRPVAPPPVNTPVVPASVPQTFQRAQPTPPPVPRQSIASVPTPPMPTVAPIPFTRPAHAPVPAAVVPPAPAPAPVSITPEAPLAPQAPIVPKPVVNHIPAPVAPPAPVAAAPVAPIMPTPAPVAPIVVPAPAPVAVVAQPAQPVPAAAPADNLPPLNVPLAALVSAWPETIRQEVARLNLGDAQIALPMGLIESSLKRGRIAFPWKTLQSWIRPAPLPSVSINDSMELELPLPVIAPLFISRRKVIAAAARTTQKVAVDEAIPNLFFGFPQPTAPAAVVAPQAPEPAIPEPAAQAVVPAANPTSETNYFLLEDSAGAQPEVEVFKRPMANATDFSSRKASPDEIIRRAAALEGVVGAMIALPDGLKVAASIPPEHNGDALAAFLPQLFNKMSQCTRELRMGELNNLNFTVGNVPWKVFRVNAVFFAAFGRPGQPLPTAQLVALAGELDRKNK